MKRLLALVLVLMLALSCAAFAEPSTAYMVALIDPIVTVDGEPMLDMTGMDVELTAMVSDIGILGMMLGAYVGQDYSTPALVARAQLDKAGVTFTADGLNNLYGVNIETLLEEMDVDMMLGGINPLDYLEMIPLNTMLRSMVEEMEPAEFTPADRIAVIEEMISSLVTETTSNADGSVTHTLVLTREDGKELLLKMAEMVDTVAEQMGENSGIAEDMREDDIAIELTGTATASGDPASGEAFCEIKLAGAMTDGDGNTVPVSIYYADDMQNISFDFVLTAANEEPGTETLAIHMTSDSSKRDDGDTWMLTKAILTIEEESATLEYHQNPDPDTAEVNCDWKFEAPTGEKAELSVVLNDGVVTESDRGFSAALYITADDEVPMNFSVSYDGEFFATETGSAHVGELDISLMNGEYALNTGIALQDSMVDSAVWAYDSTSYVDVMNMTDAQSSSAMLGLMGLAGSAIPALQDNVPGLSSYLEMMMGELMG